MWKWHIDHPEAQANSPRNQSFFVYDNGACASVVRLDNVRACGKGGLSKLSLIHNHFPRHVILLSSGYATKVRPKPCLQDGSVEPAVGQGLACVYMMRLIA